MGVDDTAVRDAGGGFAANIQAGQRFRARACELGPHAARVCVRGRAPWPSTPTDPTPARRGTAPRP